MMSLTCLRGVLFNLLLCHLGCLVESLDVHVNDALPVDPYAFDYDHNSQSNRFSDEDFQKMMESECSKLVEDACIKCSEEARRNCGNETWEPSDIPVIPQPREKDQNTCDSFLFQHFIKKIEKAFTDGQTDHVVLTLDQYRIGRLQKYLSDDSEDEVPGVDIMNMLAESLTPLASNVPYNSSWFERTFSLSFNKAVVLFVILATFATIFKLLLMGELSLLRVFCVVLLTVLIINFFWSYMLLYQKKISERMADEAQRKEYEEVCHAQKNLTAFQKFREFWGFHPQKDERCQKLIESYQIDPFLEVHPVEAITDTFERIITSLSGAFGKGLGNFNQDFFTSVSVVYWIPAMIFNLLLIAVILAVYFYCGRRRIIVQEVKDTVPQRYVQETDRIEEASLRRIEARKEPALSLPPVRQQGKVSQINSQWDDIVENRGACSSVASGELCRGDGGEIMRRKTEGIMTEERIASCHRRTEDDRLDNQKDSQNTTRSDRMAEQRFKERLNDLDTVQYERKLGTASSYREDGNKKQQSMESEGSAVVMSKKCNCGEAESEANSQKERLERDNTKGGKRAMEEQAEGVGELDEDDFIVLPDYESAMNPIK